MSTLRNYLFQSFNFRSKSKLKPFYSLVANITANNGPGAPDDVDADISNAPFADMKDIRLAASFLSNGGGAMPMNSNGASWNMGFVTTTGNVIIDLLHNFHLECGARLHKLRVYETLTDPTGREVCGYLLVRGGVHAHAYALALEKITGVDIKKMLSTPNINLDKIPESKNISMRDRQGEKALPGDPPGTLEVVDGPPTGGKIPELEGTPSAFAPDYAPEEMFEIATKLYKKSR